MEEKEDGSMNWLHWIMAMVGLICLCFGLGFITGNFIGSLCIGLGIFWIVKFQHWESKETDS
jgi:fatty acid desaturase